MNRYLRHTGGSVIERCGDRQRKFDGLKKWPFHLFIESLPVMLQIALLLLAGGLSRYMWSVNISVAGVVISSTVLGILFYIGTVVAGASSYECPFQTPASTALRRLRCSATIRKSSFWINRTVRNAKQRLARVIRRFGCALLPITTTDIYLEPPDLHHIIRILECNSGPSGPTLDFPRRGENSPTHLLWMSNLFLDLTHVGQNPTLKSYESYLSAAAADHRIVVNTLVMWYTFLGGRVENEIFWVIDKSYVTVLLPFFPACLLRLRTLAIRWN